RVSDAYLSADPPTAEETDALAEHVRTTIEAPSVEPLGAGERIIATGGTVRNLAKIERHTRPYPIPRLHGHVLTHRRVHDLPRLAHRAVPAGGRVVRRGGERRRTAGAGGRPARPGAEPRLLPTVRPHRGRGAGRGPGRVHAPEAGAAVGGGPDGGGPDRAARR